MIDVPLFLAFLAAAAILTVTPGVDTAMVLRATTVDGRPAGVAASAGIILGCLIWGAAVSLGLGAVLQASELAYAIVKFAGAAYLVWLGARLLLHPRAGLEGAVDGGAGSGRRDAFGKGFLTNMLNPKIGIFYVTFLPQFVAAGADVAGYSFFLAGVHILLTLVWFTVLIAAAAPLGKFLRKPRAISALDRLTGGVFVAFGLKLATSSVR
jgi:threonine/homoserine/homoserine lactone efflux protein